MLLPHRRESKGACFLFSGVRAILPSLLPSWCLRTNTVANQHITHIWAPIAALTKKTMSVTDAAGWVSKFQNFVTAHTFFYWSGLCIGASIGGD